MYFLVVVLVIGSLSPKEFHTTLLQLVKERKALATSLNDAETAIERLDSAVTGKIFPFSSFGP